MKKTLSIIIFAFSLFSLFAQDTLEYGDLPYYYNNYYPRHNFISVFGACSLVGDTTACASTSNGITPDSSRGLIGQGQVYITNDTLQIYGVAATYNNCYDLEPLPEIAVYQYEHDSTLYSGHGVLTELNRTRAMSRIRNYTYRATVRLCDYTFTNIEEWDNDVVSVVPAYEYYFNQPITVHDTFFVGGLNGTTPQAVYINYGHAAFLDEFIATYGHHTTVERRWNKLVIVNLPINYKILYGGFFPIIRPLHGSDSTAIDMVDYSRMVSLAPNPTDGRFTVTSDDGLRAIMIYDMTGRAVMRRNASGSRVEFDASALPKGCYILAATTTNGVARKKLILR